MLLPFVRIVVGILLALTSVAALLGVARIHMIILSFLSGGLLLSLSFFESEFNKIRGVSSGTTTYSAAPVTSSSNKVAKTD